MKNRLDILQTHSSSTHLQVNPKYKPIEISDQEQDWINNLNIYNLEKKFENDESLSLKERLCTSKCKSKCGLLYMYLGVLVLAAIMTLQFYTMASDVNPCVYLTPAIKGHITC